MLENFVENSAKFAPNFTSFHFLPEFFQFILAKLCYSALLSVSQHFLINFSLFTRQFPHEYSYAEIEESEKPKEKKNVEF